MKQTQKRGGMRKVIKRKKQVGINFVDNKSATFLPKKLTRTRILFATDLSAEDLSAMTIYSAWVKANEKFFDSRSTFPIYGFLVGSGRSQTQRAREFLNLFAEDLEWDDPEHHLYQGYFTAGNRVWNDGGDGLIPDESSMLESANILNEPDYPDSRPFVIGIEELKKVKPDNLFIFYLRNLEFIQTPGAMEFLLQVPGAIYDSGFDMTDPFVAKFMNRTGTDAPLIRIPQNDIILTKDNAGKLFKEFEDVGDDEMAFQIKTAMHALNDHILNNGISKIGDLEIFKDVDFDNYSSFKTAVNRGVPEEYQKVVQTIDPLIKYDTAVLRLSAGLTIIGALMANGTFKDTPFSFETVGNRRDLVVKDTEKASLFFQNVLIKAIKILNE